MLFMFKFIIIIRNTDLSIAMLNIIEDITMLNRILIITACMITVSLTMAHFSNIVGTKQWQAGYNRTIESASFSINLIKSSL